MILIIILTDYIYLVLHYIQFLFQVHYIKLIFTLNCEIGTIIIIIDEEIDIKSFA